MPPARLGAKMDSLSPFLSDSFIPYNMPVYPGARRLVADSCLCDTPVRHWPTWRAPTGLLRLALRPQPPPQFMRWALGFGTKRTSSTWRRAPERAQLWLQRPWRGSEPCLGARSARGSAFNGEAAMGRRL